MTGTAARPPLSERYLVYDPSTALAGAFFSLGAPTSQGRNPILHHEPGQLIAVDQEEALRDAPA
jgi:hypothetical protein